MNDKHQSVTKNVPFKTKCIHFTKIGTLFRALFFILKGKSFIFLSSKKNSRSIFSYILRFCFNPLPIKYINYYL